MKRIEEARGESERRLLLHVQSTPVAVIEYDQQFRITAWNPAAAAMFGWPAEEALGRHASLIIPESARLQVDGILRQLLDQKTGQRNVNENVTKDGRIIICDWNNTVLVSSGGEVIGVASMALDITERKRAEQALRESEERYSRMFRSHVAGFALHEVILDDRGVPCDYRFLEVNPAFESLTRLVAADIIGRTVLEVLPGTEQAWVERYCRVAQTGVPDHFTSRSAALDRVFEVTAYPAGPGRFAVMFVDVTDRVRAEEALRVTEQKFRAVIEKTTDIILVLDGDLVIRFAVTGALGYSAEELVGRPSLDLAHADERRAVEEVYRGLLARPGATARFTGRRLHKDGSWHLMETLGRNLLDDPAVRGIVLNGRDITEHRRLEEQLQQSQKLESIGRLAGGIAHDFNNLLTVILSCAETLKEDVGAGALPQPELIDEIHAAGKRAAELTRQLLAFARKQVIAPVSLDLNALVHGSEKLLRRVLGEDVEFVTTLHPALWTVRCDPGQIEQVILNLAINARDAMPGGGKLTIETTNEVIADSLVALHPFMRTGPHVRLKISDTGTGMTPGVKGHVFEPFFTTKPQGKGTGLGLATVYGIVKQSKGYILLESEAGVGTTFELYFPRTLDPTVPVPAASKTTTSGSAEIILVVEDDPQVREVTVRSLRAGGYRVIVASNGSEALEVAAREEGAFDLLLTDVIMPGLNGRELAGELRRKRPDLRVLYMSGYTQDVISQAGVLGSGMEFLTKPFTAAQLQERVRKVLGSR